jgi:hypothetical protein
MEGIADEKVTTKNNRINIVADSSPLSYDSL